MGVVKAIWTKAKHEQLMLRDKFLVPDPFRLGTLMQLYYWRRLFSSWFTHVTTQFLQVQGLGRYFYNGNVDK